MTKQRPSSATRTAESASTAMAPLGLSPGRAAWLRLRRNWLAMIALAWVAVVSLLCLSAPLVTSHDPRLELPSIGAQPAGFTHPNVYPLNRFIVGQAPATAPGVIAAANASSQRSIHYRVETTSTRDVRITLRRGRVQSIVRQPGAELLNELTINDATATEYLRSGELGEAKSGQLTVGETPPEGFFADQQRVMLLQIADAEPIINSWVVRLHDGVVEGITRDGDAQPQLIADAPSIRSVLIDDTPQTRSHFIGTDAKGRDLWARLLYGGQISLTVGLVATIVSIVIGVLYGAISGYLGGRTDRVMMSSVDILYGLPFMFLVILLLVSFGRHILVLFVALGAVQWLTMARIVRGQVLSLRGREFIEAARLCGAGPWHLISRHLIPNALGPIIVYTSLTVPVVILEESFLAFLGLTVEWNGQSLDSWGALVWQGRSELGENGERSWLLLWPAAIMTSTLLALNAVGDGLRDALDPQLKGRS